MFNKSSKILPIFLNCKCNHATSLFVSGFPFASWNNSNLLAQHSKPVRLCLNLLFQVISSPHGLLRFVPAIMNCSQCSQCSELSLASCPSAWNACGCVSHLSQDSAQYCFWERILVLHSAPTPALSSSMHLPHCTRVISLFISVAPDDKL